MCGLSDLLKYVDYFFFFTYNAWFTPLCRGLPAIFSLGGGNKFIGERLKGGWLWSGFDGGKGCVQMICMALRSMGDRWYPWVILCGVGGKPNPASLSGPALSPRSADAPLSSRAERTATSMRGEVGLLSTHLVMMGFGLHGDVLRWKALGSNGAFKHLGDFMWGRWTPGLDLHPVRPAAPGVRTLHFPPRRRGPVPACRGRPG